MSLSALFIKNPFENLAVASSATAAFPLRGHEDQLDQRVKEVLEAIDHPDYPATAQHTIVFGEWGHGKTHVLRTFEHRINSERSKQASAVFFEPPDSKPEDVFISLCKKLEITASDPSKFITAVRNKHPENLFLLIDETQSIVGEELSEDLEKSLEGYWQLLGQLQKEASNQLYGLHIFHGLSANSARAINKIGQIPTIREFQKYIFTLQSLSEEEQWEMLCDHLKKGANDPELQPETILDRGINQCLNELTGGNPRYSLSLMGRIFDSAKAQEAERIDGSMCYQTLQLTPRLDASSSNYFDKNRINQVLNELKEGQQSERKIAELLERKMSTLLGEWKGVEQAELEEFGLTTATIRTECGSLQRAMTIFEQPPGCDEFRLRHDFLNKIGAIRQRTLSDSEDKTLLLKLQLEPETQISSMMIGLREVMIFNFHPGRWHEVYVGYTNRLYQTSVSQDVPVQVALNVFKGKEVPIELYRKIIELIESEKFTVVLLIEDADTSHDLPGGTWEKFKDSYSGPIDLESRFLFINGTDPEGKKFDEDFFVRLASPNIGEGEARDWYDRLQIDKHLAQIRKECIYCPAENERVLIDELTKQGRSYKIGEIKALKDSFDWTSRARLVKLGLYIDKDGGTYRVPPIERIRPIKYILRELQTSSDGLKKGVLDKLLASKFIRTGDAQSIQSHTDWLLTLLEGQSKVKLEGEVFHYKDLDRELQALKEKYENTKDLLDKEISKYEIAEIDIARLGQLSESTNEVAGRIDDAAYAPVEQKILEYKDANRRLEDIQKDLEKVPEDVRTALQGQLDELQNLAAEVNRKAAWPNQDANPYKSLYGLGGVKKNIATLEDRIAEQIPQQRSCRQNIVSIRKQLKALEALLAGELSTGSYEGKDAVDQCIFRIFNAVRDGKPGTVTVRFSQPIRNES